MTVGEWRVLRSCVLKGSRHWESKTKDRVTVTLAAASGLAQRCCKQDSGQSGVGRSESGEAGQIHWPTGPQAKLDKQNRQSSHQARIEGSSHPHLNSSQGKPTGDWKLARGRAKGTWREGVPGPQCACAEGQRVKEGCQWHDELAALPMMTRDRPPILVSFNWRAATPPTSPETSAMLYSAP